MVDRAVVYFTVVLFVAAWLLDSPVPMAIAP